MRASEVLHKMLAPTALRLDARLWRRLCGAVEALVRSRQVVLMELARQYPGAARVAAPLKALDRLLSNRRLQQARGALYGAALQRLWPRRLDPARFACRAQPNTHHAAARASASHDLRR